MPGNAVLERSKCIVCKALPEDKVLQCTNGHIHCDQCFSTTRPCEVCGITTPCETRSTFAEQELELLELDCIHGCELKVKWKELRAHAETCISRQFVPLCSQMGLDCDFKIPRNNIQAVINHFCRNHKYDGGIMGAPFSIILEDFKGASKDSMKSHWTPLLVRSAIVGTAVMLKLDAVYTVLLASAIPAENSLSVVVISLSDLYPPRTEIQPSAQFSIKCAGGGRRVSNLGMTVDPYPSMNCRRFLAGSPNRQPISLLLPSSVGPDGSLKIECKISPGNEEGTRKHISIPLARIIPVGDRVGEEEAQRQRQLVALGEPSGSPASNGNGRTIRRARRGRSSRGEPAAAGSGTRRGRRNRAGPYGSLGSTT